MWARRAPSAWPGSTTASSVQCSAPSTRPRTAGLQARTSSGSKKEMERAAASRWRAKVSMTARADALAAMVRELIGRKPMPGTDAPTSSQRRRARRATSSSMPERRPLIHTRPKLRTDAPVGPALGLQMVHGEPRLRQLECVPGADDAAAGDDGAPASPPSPEDDHASAPVAAHGRGPDGVGGFPRSRVPEDGAAGHQHIGAGGDGDRGRVRCRSLRRPRCRGRGRPR